MIKTFFLLYRRLDVCMSRTILNQGRIRDAISYLCFRRRSQFIHFNRRPKYPKIWQNCKGSENLRVFSVKNNLNNSKLINLAHLLLLDTLALIAVRSMIQDIGYIREINASNWNSMAKTKNSSWSECYGKCFHHTIRNTALFSFFLE